MLKMRLIWKVYRIFIFHPIFMHFFLWIDWNEMRTSGLMLTRFPLSLMVSEINFTERGQVSNSKILTFINSPDPKGHMSFCHYWASVVHPSVNFSHFDQLLWRHWANLNQTLVEWSLNGPLPKFCPVILTSNQDGR